MVHTLFQHCEEVIPLSHLYFFSCRVLEIIDIVANNAQVSNKSFQFTSSQFGFMVAEVRPEEGESYQPALMSLLQQLVNLTILDNTSSINVSSVDVDIPRRILTNGTNTTRLSTAIFTNHALFQPRDQYIRETGEKFTQVGSSVLAISVLGETVSGLNDDERVQFVFSKTQVWSILRTSI